jgi:hypothetical protein
MFSFFLSHTAPNDYLNEAKNIVDGNRDRTLFLLWQILYGFELKMVGDIFCILGLNYFRLFNFSVFNMVLILILLLRFLCFPFN